MLTINQELWLPHAVQREAPYNPGCKNPIKAFSTEVSYIFSEITQINQYEGLLHSQWGNHMLQILQEKEKTIPVKHNHKAQHVNGVYSQYRWATLFLIFNSS